MVVAEIHISEQAHRCPDPCCSFDLQTYIGQKLLFVELTPGHEVVGVVFKSFLVTWCAVSLVISVGLTG